MKRTLALPVTIPLGLLLGASLGAAAPLAQLAGPDGWTAWKAAGDWKWTEVWVGGVGTDQWRYAEAGSAEWRDYQVDLRLRIDTASSREGPKWEAGNWTWAAYRNNVNAPDYEAGLALRKQGNEMYRVMFSLRAQEVVLWSSRGGFLRVVPLKLEAGRDYAVRASARGPHIKVAVDRRTVIDYYERHGVLASGAVALGLHEGAAAFNQVSVTSLPSFTGQIPPHVADFRFRDWKGAHWAWDGDEPIFFLNNNCLAPEMKLVPGWRPQLNGWWHWQNYFPTDSFYLDRLTDYQVLEEGGRLRLLVTGTDGKDPKMSWLTQRNEVTVTYDPKMDAYVYDTVSNLIVPEGHALKVVNNIEFTDSTVYGHVGSAGPHDSWETPHPWSVYKQLEGKLYKQPHNHLGWFAGWNEPAYIAGKGNFLAPDGWWALVGDPVANPIWSVLSSSIPGSQFHTELCAWGFDVHMCWHPIKGGGTLQPGTYTVNWRLTSVDGKQGDAWLKQAELFAPTDPDKTVLLYTAGIGEVEKFNKLVKFASPFYEWAWGDGKLQDTTVGHGDKTSVRLEGLRSSDTPIVGGSYYNDSLLENTDYEVSAWVKTKDVQGEGPGLMFGKQYYYPGITGTQDWQRVGFVCRPAPPLYGVYMQLLNSGSGTVWFDDFMIRPLKVGEKPAAPIAAAPRPLPTPPAGGGLVLFWNGKSDVGDPGRTLLDQSGCGNHGRLEGTAAAVDEEGQRVLSFDGGAGYVTGDRGWLFTPPQTVSLWLKPGTPAEGPGTIATGGDWRRAWALSLQGAPPYSLSLSPWGRHMATPGLVPLDKWTHMAITDDGKTITLYVNGAAVKAEAFGGPDWAAMEGPFVLGTRLAYGVPGNSFTGLISGVKFWNKALAAEEVKAAFGAGIPQQL